MTAGEAAEMARLLLASTMPLNRSEHHFLRDLLWGRDPPSAKQARWLIDIHRRAIAWYDCGGEP